MNQPLRPRQFASDNWSGVCPEAWAAMTEANAGHAASYGDDGWTELASNLIRDLFETRCEVFFTFNGTASNSLALASTCQSYHSILCHQTAHVETHECGAPEFFSNGTKVLLVPGEHGKMSPAEIENAVVRRRDIHYPKPRAISLTQATEWGTVYSIDELRAIDEIASKHGLRIHMDGARFANAVATLGAKPKEITWQAGVDVLCLGGSKNGMALGEAVVFFDQGMAHEFDYRCKQAGQLASKMRYLSAPWVGMLRSDAWLTHAAHANRMATLLHGELERAGFRPLHPCEANMVFVELPEGAEEAMHARGWTFHSMTGRSDYRFVCSWDTQEEDVKSFAADLKAARRASG
jgi:threonine aldolase